MGGEPGRITNDEIMFDAADSRRFGKDVFFQAHYGFANHLGREWVRRELRAGGLRVYDAEWEQFHHSHMDARLTPVDEGLAFYSSQDPPRRRCETCSRRTSGTWWTPGCARGAAAPLTSAHLASTWTSS